jgi:hypothetical protein
MNRRELEEIGMALAIVLVLGLVYVAYASASDIQGAIPTLGEVLSGSSGLVIVGLLALLSGVIGVALAAIAVRYWFGSGVWLAGSIKAGWDRVTPNSILGRAALWVMILIVVLMAFIGAIPAFTGDLSEADEGAVGFANRLSDNQLNSGWSAIIEDDDLDGTAACRERSGSPPGGDADGDGIPDDWERAGETPRGAPLPGASPDHRDLYVQLNYGDTVTPLTEGEKEQLRATWAEMPVTNPDGTAGIRLHLDEESPGAGALGEQAIFQDLERHERYYDESVMGPRQCVYHQVVVGQLEGSVRAGAAATPGHHAIIDGTTRSEYDGGVTFRVAIATHELLHNVVGPVEDQPHTADGWLAGGPDNEFLSDATQAAIEENGLTPVGEPAPS